MLFTETTRVILQGNTLAALRVLFQATCKRCEAACVVCADSYGVSDQLRELGLEVKGMGGPLSDFIKDDSVNVVTF